MGAALSEQTRGNKPLLIGITTYAADAEGGRFSVPRDYVDAVRRAGGLPVLLPPGETDVAQLIDSLEGLVLTGGGDVAPERYGSSGGPAVYGVNAERDSFEIALVHCAVAQQLPLLAICRGLQVLNVALGGTLIEHLPAEVGEQLAHRAPPHHPIEHTVCIADDCRLATLLRAGEVNVKSWHHQGLRAVAPQLQVVARAADGVVEAVEMPAHPWLLGVQWHPELTAAQDLFQQRLFEQLIAAARQRRASLERRVL
jgi:putative glutamine amidotransferase